MNTDNMDTLIAFLIDRNKEERFDIAKYHHTCGTPSCIIGWAYTLHTGNDKVEVDPVNPSTWYGSEVMITATTELLNISEAQACEIATGWENVYGWDNDEQTEDWIWHDGVDFDTVIQYLTKLKEEPHMTWQEFHDHR